MAIENDSEFSGKKIFFLYPSSLIQNEIAYELVQQEYEVYLIKDHLKIKRVLKKFPDSIVFINVDDGVDEKSWEAWMKGLLADPFTARIKLGLLTAMRDEALEKKFSTTFKLPCGYTEVSKSDPLKTVKTIFGYLLAVEARGRRKYLRASSENDTQMTINIPYNSLFLKGVIKDISVTGLSCVFQEDPMLDKNTLCQDMQIKLQSIILKTEAICFGSRPDGLQKIYVFLFTQRIDPDVRIKIRSFIQSLMQSKLEKLLR
ncbi:MAG: PilZ domain-containing protein [Treponema sp.]|jgi:hypothetical protein|nr:PilZ domain-containing protein [Treponema sp.]